jgi:hypothetical protein
MNRSLASLALVVAAGCSLNDGPMLGVATATITVVPPMVSCIQITVAGSRTVTRSFDVQAGKPSIENLAGLPVGAVTFTGAAFGQSCALVTGSSVPSWLSDATPATLFAGQVASVTLVMKKNAAANVGVDFVDDGDGGAPPSGDGGPGPVLDLSSPPNADGGLPPPPADLATSPDLIAPFDLAPPPNAG